MCGRARRCSLGHSEADEWPPGSAQERKERAMDHWMSGPGWGWSAVAARLVAAQDGTAASRRHPAARRRGGGVRRTLATALAAVARHLDPTHAARQDEP